VYESGVVRLWEVARFNKLRGAVLLPRNLIKIYICVCSCIHVVVRSNLCRNLVLQGFGKL